MAPLPVLATASPRDVYWGHCRNALGIARLLVHEGRPQSLVATACRMAAEAACRAALEQAEFPFDGDLERSLDHLSAPAGLWDEVGPATAAERLAAAEHVVAWVARYLRSEAPERTWGY